jgi:hypothetical protein
MLFRVALVRTTRATRRNIPEDGILHSGAVKTSNLTVFLYGEATHRHIGRIGSYKSHTA